jgi:hypothetical protein
MSVALNKAFVSLSELKIWFKNFSGEELTLADLNDIISLRWGYFRDNWSFVRRELIKTADQYEFPDMLYTQIDELGRFIERQRNSSNKEVNPFRRNTILSDYYAVWDSLTLSSIPITRQEQNIADAKKREINRYVKTDFLRIRSDLFDARDEIADVIGLSDENYNAAIGRSSVTQLRGPRISDITNMQTLMNGVIAVDYILANINSLETVSVDPFTLARTNADNPEVDIQDYKSGRLVKMNYGDSLQDLAGRYLLDPDKWVDIAIANGLKAPYIDEIGEAITIISNGDGSQLNIAREDTAGNKNVNKLYINQAVFLKSDATTQPEQRTITNIKEVPISGEIVLELSGENDLDRYKVSDNAIIRVYKKNTVNSNFMVLIPSLQPLPEQRVGTDSITLESLAEDEKNAGVDFAVNDDMDIVFTSTNDLQLSFGLPNVVQAVKYKILTEKGAIPRHKSYGLPNVSGRRADDPEGIQAELIRGITDMIDADSRFSRIERLDVVRSAGNQYTIKLAVRMAGTGTVVPISFNVNTG